MDDVIVENIRGVEIKFKTRPGVFSKAGIDDGTRLLIDQIEIEDNTVIADLGSGTGIVGLYAGISNSRGHVHLLDSNLRAIELAKENIELNNLLNVEVFLSDLFSAVSDRTYNQIFSNPPQQLGNEFLEELVFECHKHLKVKGILFLVVKKNVRPFMERLLEKTFGNFEVVTQGREHFILKSEKH